LFHLEALACELAARFYLEIGDISSSLQHFTLAHENYDKWGATGKASQLFVYVSEKFVGFLGNSEPIETRGIVQNGMVS
jgi:hypothetical protein